MTSEFSQILYDAKDGIARVTLNRPERRNAITYEMQVELHAALLEADNDSAVHCVVLKGAGGNFSSGYDISPAYKRYPKLGEQEDGTAYRTDKYYESFDDDMWTLQRGQDLRMIIFDMYKPVIAQVSGYCLAGGTDLALLCDIIIAAENAEIGFPPVRDMGSPPSHMWLYHLGPQWAKRMLLTGDSLSGKDAAQLGLVLKAVPEDLLEDEVTFLARRFANIDSGLLAANKRIVNLGLELMGTRTMQRMAIDADARGHMTRAAKNYRDLARGGGLKAAIEARNRDFGDGLIRVNDPEVIIDKP